MFRALGRKFKISRQRLYERTAQLELRIPERLLGMNAIRIYERRMLLALEGMQHKMELKSRLNRLVMRMEGEVYDRQNRSITVDAAARYVAMPRVLFRFWVEDMGLVELDMDGKIPLPELKRFYTENWHLILISRRKPWKGQL